jgi:uncharacterized OB-fold protein
MEYKLTFEKFREGLRAGKLLGLKCNDCAGYTAPPQKVCSQCGSENMDIVELSKKGEIQTFTVINVVPEGFQPPVTVAVAALKEGPWLMGDIIDINPDDVNMNIIGRQVSIGYKEVPGDMFSAGDRIALTFKLVG